MQSLLEYLSEQGAVKASKVIGPNGAFISAEHADGTKFTLPVGKRSQDGTLKEYNVMLVQDKDDPEIEVAIATVNMYEEAESIVLV